MIRSCCPKEKKCRSAKKVMGKRELHTISWKYGQRLGEVLPHIYAFNVHWVNGIISDAGSMILQFETGTQPSSF